MKKLKIKKFPDFSFLSLELKKRIESGLANDKF